MSRGVEGKDIGISIKNPGEDKVWDNRVVKGMKGVENQGLAARFEVAPLEGKKASLYLNIQYTYTYT